ncbi:hypothetical protein K2173_018080 [Erythroxylum novogranatense]|uniref:Cytochrome P450 n=1 Tax=Erythroxylum novogranatense TaxID=1862640 RepID=A0AAV8TX40_9ROSI|nr:hypothetical protein K2173_018080 [Erythroxylum novogranatense]
MGSLSICSSKLGSQTLSPSIVGTPVLSSSKLGAPAFIVAIPNRATTHRLPVKVCCSATSEADSTPKKTIPGPMKLPFIGNLYNLVGSPPHHALRDLAKQYGPLMHVQLGEISALVVSSAELAEEVLKTHELSFAQRPNVLASSIMTYGGQDLVFSPYGDYWKQMRKICVTEMLSPRKVQSFSSVRHEEVANLLKFVRASAGKPFDFTERVFLYTNKVTCRTAFGNTCSEELQDAVLEGLREATALAGGFDLADLFPSLEFLQGLSGIKSKLERIQEKMTRLLDEIIQDHKEELMNSKNGTADAEDDDLVNVLLKSQEGGNLKCPITTTSLKAVILDMFVAGTDTSSLTVEWAMSEMMRNPRVLKKAQAEVRRVFKGKEKITDEDVQQLSYLKLVIKEALRLHPPAPLLLPRETREACVIDGYEIPEKTKLMVNAYSIGRDPKYWREPLSFMPERFEDSSVDFRGLHFQYLPFGAGRRICPGITFGMANIELPIAQLLYHFDWKLPEGTTPENLDMTEGSGATIGRKATLYLVPTPHVFSHDESNQSMETMQVLN